MTVAEWTGLAGVASVLLGAQHYYHGAISGLLSKRLDGVDDRQERTELKLEDTAEIVADLKTRVVVIERTCEFHKGKRAVAHV